jgi:7-cyano-7-deazaguanine reductase
MKDNVINLHNLGSHGNTYSYDTPNSNILECFENQFSERNYVTEFVFHEFTSLCPKTGQPDFATITIQYIADKLCIETKSLKTYYLSYRQHGAFMETLTNEILEDCVKVCSPKWMKVTSQFNPRGGTSINVYAEYKKELKESI